MNNKFNSLKVEEASSGSIESMLVADINETAHADLLRKVLEDFHKQVHPDWDDMTLAGWLEHQDPRHLKHLKQYLDYVSCYTQYAIDAAMVNATNIKL